MDVYTCQANAKANANQIVLLADECTGMLSAKNLNTAGQQSGTFAHHRPVFVQIKSD